MHGNRNGRACPNRVLFLLLSLALVLVPYAKGRCQSTGSDAVRGERRLQMDQAVMCEEVQDLAPVNVSVVFSVDIGKVSCFTLFDPVPQKTVVYHTWFHRDEESTRKRLALRPPRWSTVSSIQLRETDKGPWRVVISDDTGHIFGIMRFSVTD